MSIDGYYCFCCLATDDLISLCDQDKDANYICMLKELFALKPSQDYEDDTYICEDCSGKLKDAHSFKRQVFSTINILQINGLVALSKVNGELVITRVSSDCDAEAKKDVKKEPTTDFEDIKEFILKENIMNSKPQTDQQIIKIENAEVKILENFQILHGVDIIRPVLKESIKALERANALGDSKKDGIKRDGSTERDGTKRDEFLSKKMDSVEALDDLKCPICVKDLPNMYMYNKHMNEHFPNHICEMCGKGFMTKRKLNRHKSCHDKGPFECDACDAVFTNSSTYYAHRQRTHFNVHQYACPHCAARFRTYPQRAAHLTAAHGQNTRKYVCPVCRKTFLLSGNLSQHMRNQHMKIKRHFCTECDAAFFHKQDLVGHMASHTGENMFQCTVCSKSYPRKKSLKVHMLTHTDNKPFPCNACAKKFAQKSALLSHMKTHNCSDKRLNPNSGTTTKVAKLKKSVTKVSDLTPKVLNVVEFTSKVVDIIPKVVGRDSETDFTNVIEITPSNVVEFTSKVVDIMPKVVGRDSKTDFTNVIEIAPSMITSKVTEVTTKVEITPKVDVESMGFTPKTTEKEQNVPKVNLVDAPDKALYNCYKLFY